MELDKKRNVKRKLRHFVVIAGVGLMGAGWFQADAYAASPKGETPEVLVGQYVFKIPELKMEEELMSLLADSVGKTATLQDLEMQADAVTRCLRSKGYLVATAYIPPQDFANGKVELVVAPGYYDEIVIENETVIHEKAIRRELGGVRPGAVIEKAALERVVWLIGDMANAEAKATLQAGAKPGTSTLVIHVKPKGNPTWGYIGFDNGGYRYTGRYETSALINRANLAKEGDILSASLLYTGQGQTGGSLSYSSPVWNQGSRVGVSYSRSTYNLGGVFESMGATGEADTLSLSYQKNYHRSRSANLYGAIRFDSKRLRDDLDFFAQNGRKGSRSWVTELYGDSLDNWHGGGQNTYSFSYTYGDLDIKDEVSRLLDSPAFGGLDTDGHFGKYNFNVARLQNVGERLAFYLSYERQWATKNLDSSEKMSLGGPYGVRAYPLGEASGDQGWIGTAELRWNLPKKETEKDSFQLIAFMDGGAVQMNKSPGLFAGGNHRSLSGYGVGVNWSDENNWAARLHYSWKLGTEEAVSDKDHQGRLWFQLYKFF